MKKSFFWAATAALVLTSCSNDTESIAETANSANVVSFRTVSEKTEGGLKTTMMTEGNITNFAVYAYVLSSATGFDFMTEQPVIRKQGGSWAYAPAKFWPQNKSDVHFYAYSPAGSVNTNVQLGHVATQTKATLTYTVPLKAEVTASDPGPVDFLVAAKTVKYDAVTTFAYPKVTLMFQHALSVVQFTAKNTTPNSKFIIDEIKLVQLANKGTLTINEAGTTIGWTGQPTFDQIYEASLPGTGIHLEYSATATSLTSTNEGLLVLPQPAGTVASNGPVTVPRSATVPTLEAGVRYVAITYRAIDTAGGEIIPASTKYFPFSMELFPNTKYTFDFVLTAGAEVQFNTPQVGPWGSGATTEVPIP